MKQYTLEGRRHFLRNAPNGSTDSVDYCFRGKQKLVCWTSCFSPFSLQSSWIKMTTLWPLLCLLHPPTVSQSASSKWTQQGRGRSICCVFMVSVQFLWLYSCCTTSVLGMGTNRRCCWERKLDRVDFLGPGNKRLLRNNKSKSPERLAVGGLNSEDMQKIGAKISIPDPVFCSASGFKVVCTHGSVPQVVFCAQTGGIVVNIK